MLGRSKQLELENRCFELVQTGDRQRRELGDACREVKHRLRWVETTLATIKSSGPLFMGAAGVAGLFLGRSRKTGVLSWVSRLQVGMRVFRMVRQFLREQR
jgi:hypothetical protein